MIEGLFILTTVFVAYVVYVMIDEQKTAAKSKAQTVKSKAQAQVAAEQPKPEVAAVVTEKPAAVKPVAANAATPEPVATEVAAPKTTPKSQADKAAKPATAKKTAAVAAKSAGLKNPKTGGVAATYSNYRFTKRWIKEALVTEGFLEKIYKNNELNAETEAEIKEAIAKLEALDKYKA